MGNIAHFAAAGNPTAPTFQEVNAVYIQASRPDEIRERFLEAVAERALSGQELWDVSIGGAGDGHSFLLVVSFYVPPAPQAPPVDIICYMASSSVELGKALVVAKAEFAARHAGDGPHWRHAGHTVVGSSTGHRFMGIIFAIYVEP